MGREAGLIRSATLVARTSQHPKWKHGALLVRGNRILASSPNKFRCDPFIDFEAATWHAEEQVLRRALLSGPEMFSMWPE